MSQYPSPYPPKQQPSYYGQPPQSPAELLAPARRAGVLMITLGVLFVLGGLCMAFAGTVISSGELATTPQGRQLQQQFDQLESQAGMSVRTLMLIAGACPLAAGALLGAMGFFVRGGGMGAVITSMVLVAVLALFLGFILLAVLVQGVAGRAGGAEFVGAVCVYGLPLFLLVLLLVWLIQAARASSKLEQARQQFQAQMWHYQQQQQMYQQPGTGTGTGVAPPPGAPGPGSGPTPGGYHQYPGPLNSGPQNPAPPAAPPGSTGSSESGDRSDGPPAQG